MEPWGGVRQGEEREPDYRFTLANERTFLAWIRTALGLLAAGVAVRQVAEPFDITGGRTVMALALVGLSAGAVVQAYRRWATVQQAMRVGQPLPPSRAVPALAMAMVAIAVLTVVLLLAG